MTNDTSSLAPTEVVQNQDTTLEISPRSFKKSFAAVVGNQSPQQEAILGIKKPSVHNGKPAVILNLEEHDKLCTPLKFALIGSFSYSRPSLQEIKNFFAARGLKGQIQIGLLNQRQVLLRPSLQDDYTRIWERKTWTINSSIMRVIKWSPQSHTMKESPIAPVWISLPKLPVHYFDKSMLFAIASAIGTPLKLDEPTANLSRPSVARILVEIDISQKVPNEIWLGVEKDGFYQPIVYENIPYYCLKCFKMGHSQERCRIFPIEKQVDDKNIAPTNENVSKPNVVDTTKKQKQIYVPKKVSNNTDKGKDKVSFLEIAPPSSLQAADSSNEDPTQRAATSVNVPSLEKGGGQQDYVPVGSQDNTNMFPHFIEEKQNEEVVVVTPETSKDTTQSIPLLHPDEPGTPLLNPSSSLPKCVVNVEDTPPSLLEGEFGEDLVSTPKGPIEDEEYDPTAIVYSGGHTLKERTKEDNGSDIVSTESEMDGDDPDYMIPHKGKSRDDLQLPGKKDKPFAIFQGSSSTPSSPNATRARSNNLFGAHFTDSP